MTIAALRRLSPLYATCLGFIALLALCRLGLNASFWLSLSNLAKGPYPAIFLCIGACFTVLEMLGLSLWERRRRRDSGQNAIWMALWVAFVAINLVADMGGIATLVAKDTAARAEMASYHDRVVAAEATARYQRDQLISRLQDSGRDLPASVLTAKRSALQALITRRGKAGPTYSQQVELGVLNEAIATAAERDKAEARRAIADAALRKVGAKPDALPPSFQEYATLLDVFGVKTSADEVHAAIMFMIAILIQATLVIGPWYVLKQIPEDQPHLAEGDALMVGDDQIGAPEVVVQSKKTTPGQAVLSAAQPSDKPAQRPKAARARSSISVQEINALLGVKEAEQRHKL